MSFVVSNYEMSAFLKCLFVMTILANVRSRSVINIERMKTYNFNKSLEGSVAIPGGIYTQSLEGVTIPPILEGYNDVQTRWLAYDSWMFHTSFNVTEDHLQHEAAKLVFEGIDTVARVELNGVHLGDTNNMFVSYVYHVKDILRTDQANNLTIRFVPPTQVANERSILYYTAPDCVPSNYHGECHANQIRKMQMAFGWDWGPAFPSVGLWKPVHIEFYDTFSITSVSVNTILEQENTWSIDAKVYFESYPTAKRTLKGYLLIAFNNMLIRNNIDLTFESNGTGVVDFSLDLKDNSVDTWWPNGAGEQKLYDLDITLGLNEYPMEVAVKHLKIGFRTIELVQRNISEIFVNQTSDYGYSFYFKVNGVPIFMKGTNWIPVDVLPENTLNKSRIDHLLYSARDAHMNMVRVWGGGIYESDYFYQKCDELGILVWQDFMFACSMYPTDEEFLTSVKDEVRQTVLRLQHHPSIALWAGNNENEAALRSNWYGTGKDFDRYKKEYITLYVDTIMKIVKNLDTRHYVTSSPTNGRKSIEEGYIAQNPYDPHYGDTHYYNYIADNWDQNTIPLTRFASEYGVQSIPSRRTMMTAKPNSSDLDISSAFMQHRQHSPAGYQMIQLQFARRLGPVKATEFDKYVYYSQISQAMSIKSLTEFFRQSQQDWLTMGALYWQLNDVWQAPSWSSIEYGGKWKLLHFFARSFFSPILVSPRLLSTGEVDVYLLNDNLHPLTNVTISVEVFKWSSLETLTTSNYTIELILPMSSTKIVKRMNLLGKDTKEEVFWRFRVQDNHRNKLGHRNSKVEVPDNFIFPVPLKSVRGLKKPSIQLQVDLSHRRGRHYTYDLRLRVDTVVLFLWLESEVEGHFSDNGMVVTEPQVQLSFTSKHYFKYEKDLIENIRFQYYLN